MKMQKKSNYGVWPAPSSKFLKMARGPKSLATPALVQDNVVIWRIFIYLKRSVKNKM